jgi:ATP citrate (pro-S)-lyase
MANSVMETAAAKNKALEDAGAHVPSTFEDMPVLLEKIYAGLTEKGIIVPRPEPEVPKIPIDYAWAQEVLPNSLTILAWLG